MVTGHSLGAGVAALISLKLRPVFPGAALSPLPRPIPIQQPGALISTGSQRGMTLTTPKQSDCCNS